MEEAEGGGSKQKTVDIVASRKKDFAYAKKKKLWEKIGFEAEKF